ncbi:MAG: thiamine diphosphokinase [Ignavibacteria bacterium]
MKHTINNCIICLNGELQKRLVKSFIRQNSKRNSYKLIAADGCAETLLKFNIIPDFIIGDLDSVSDSTLSFFKTRGSKIICVKEQEHNDFEKSLKFALKNGLTCIAVMGFGGKRNDHLLNNYSILKKYSSACSIKLIDNQFEIFFLPKSYSFQYKIGKEISLIAFPKAGGIHTQGLKYGLKNGELIFGEREGALNEASEKNVSISFRSGGILIFKRHFYNLHFDKIFGTH